MYCRLSEHVLRRSCYESANRTFFTLQRAQNNSMKAREHFVTKAHRMTVVQNVGLSLKSQVKANR